MAGRISPGRADPGPSLGTLDRLSPPPRTALLAELVERHTEPGDVVLDLQGRAGRVARVAIERGRRAVSLESEPLTRLLAELVLRPPDVSHLDAARDALAGSGLGNTTVRQGIDALFETRCPRCREPASADEFTWKAGRATASPARKRVRCPACTQRPGVDDPRDGPVDMEDRQLAVADPRAADVRAALRERFPVPEAASALPHDLLQLHTDRQLLGLAWILGAIEGEVRAEPIEAALRLALLHAVSLASRLSGPGGTLAPLRVTAGRLRPPRGATWSERNPWLAFEEGFRSVRAFVEPLSPIRAQFVDTLEQLADAPTNVVVRIASPAALATLADEAIEQRPREPQARVRLAIGHVRARPTREATAFAFHATAWALGREAAAALPIEPLLGQAPGTTSKGWAAAVRDTLDAVAPAIARDGRAVLLVDETGAEPLVAAALGAAAAGYRLLEAQSDRDEPGASILELAPPGASLPPGPRTRANVALSPVVGGAGDPEVVPGRGLFGAAEPIDARRFSATEAAKIVSQAAVALLQARGEPASHGQLLAAILVGLDRSGQLRRFATMDPEGATDPVDRFTALIAAELTWPGQRRLVELEPDRWWLADREDRQSASTPLADRVEWAVYSVLSTAGSISERAFRERLAGLFPDDDVPDGDLVRACLDSYRTQGGPSGRLVTDEDLVRRSVEQSELLAGLVDGGHRLGMQVWVGLREQARLVDGVRLADRLSDRELDVHLPVVARGPVDELEAVDCIWYQTGRAALFFEVEWTAMLGDLVLRRHARIPADDRVVRFLAVPPERGELVRAKIARSPLLRAALAEGNWHIVKWNHLRTFLASDSRDLDGLEPLVGLDPAIERAGGQLPLFAGRRYP